jgi:hypothetical protein
MTLNTYARNRVDWFYQLARCLEISHSSVRLGLLVGTFLNEDRFEIRPGHDWFMKHSGLGKTTLIKCFHELSANGFLQITDFGGDQRLRISFPFDGDDVWKREMHGSESEPCMVQKVNHI